MLERQHFNISGIGHIHGGNDAPDATQVVGVIGDHQRVVAGVHIDGVVGTDQRAQHGDQVVGRFVVETKNLGHHLVANGAARAGFMEGDCGGLQFGIGLGHHLVQVG